MKNKENIILGSILATCLLMLAGLIGYTLGQSSNMRYGKCTQQVMEVRYVCTSWSSHGACYDYGLREVPLCIQWEK